MSELKWSDVPPWLLRSSYAGIAGMIPRYDGLAYPSYMMQEQKKPQERDKDNEENKN